MRRLFYRPALYYFRRIVIILRFVFSCWVSYFAINYNGRHAYYSTLMLILRYCISAVAIKRDACRSYYTRAIILRCLVCVASEYRCYYYAIFYAPPLQPSSPIHQLSVTVLLLTYDHLFCVGRKSFLSVFSGNWNYFQNHLVSC